MAVSVTPSQSWGHRLAPGRDVSALDIGIGLVLSVGAVGLVTNAISGPGRHGGVVASLAVLTMTLPVIWRRRYPVEVAVVLGLAAAFNALAIGRMVRCGPCLPALLLTAFALGRRADVRSRRLIAVGLGALVVSGAVQSVSDPNLDPDILVALVPAGLALFAIGRLVTSHSAVVARLSQRHDELRLRRLDTAEIAAQADRARIADGLDDMLRLRITDMAAAAEAGQQALQDTDGSAATQQAFDTIERTGRETLQQMRRVVGTLLEPDPPTRPQPDLDQLEQLVTRAPDADVRLTVEGIRRALPAGLELSAYRTVEHLLDAFAAGSGEQITITVVFGVDSLTLSVRGPAPAVIEQRAALAASQARVALHRGALSSTQEEGHWEATARLPLLAHV